MRCRCGWRRVGCGLLAAALIAGAARAFAYPAVFDGDPTDATGRPYILLPGLPRVEPGADGKWGTADDVIATDVVGDVDLVVRSGGTYTPGSGVIPPPSPGVAGAPGVTAGGLQFPLAGTELPFDVIVSDGAATPAAGHPLTNTDLDGRGVLVLAYADLDGDGVIGPTNDDPAGSADNALEQQEALFLAGRRLALLQAGLASGGLGVTLGLPASAGGLGIAIAAGAITGSTPPLYKDGPWIATLLPCMWPTNPDAIIGGENTGPPDPVGLVDLEIAKALLFCPPPGHPVLGTPYAIPLDGSSITNDVARAVSGAASAVAFARPIAAAGFTPAITRRVQPLVGAGGSRQIVEPIGSISLADDGPGNGRSFLVFPADALGNQADPPSAGSAIELRASADLRIVSPDADLDPLRETIALDGPAPVSVVLDDAGGPGDGASGSQLVALLDGQLAGALRVVLGPAGPPQAIAPARVVLRFTGVVPTEKMTGRFDVLGDPAALDPSTHDLTLVARNEKGEIFYERTFPAGLLTPGGDGRSFRYQDPTGLEIGRIMSLVVRRGAVNSQRHRVRIAVKGVDLSRVDHGGQSMKLRAAFGARDFTSSLACQPGAQATTSVCTR